MTGSSFRSSRTGRALKSTSTRKPNGTSKDISVTVQRVETASLKGKIRNKPVKPGVTRTVSLNIQARTNAVAEALGSKANLARLLKVTASQPTRWISGAESPNAENTRTIIDLDHVVARLRLLWGDDDTVSSWLTGRNAFLDGARPVDVIAMQGSAPVIEALDQETAGAFA